MVVKTKEQDPIIKDAPNSPKMVRKSFLDYLRTTFPYKQDWKHPAGMTISHSQIKSVLSDYKLMDPKSYRALWYLWTTQGTRAFIAEQIMFSPSTVNRMWDKSINVIMMMLFFEDLKPEEFVLFYSAYD